MSEENTSMVTFTPQNPDGQAPNPNIFMRPPATASIGVQLPGLSLRLPRAGKYGPPRLADKVAIVGSAAPSVNLAPWDNHDWEIWGLAWRHDLPRVNRLFDIHRINRTRTAVPNNYEEHLTAKNVPVILQRQNRDIPSSFAFPLDDAIDAFGDYFASSIAYMIAMAILEDYKEIALFGVDLLDDSEYAYQRPNAEHLLGIAVGRGIKVRVPQTSALLKFNHRYGYDLPPDHGSITPEVIAARLEQYRKHQEDALHAAAGHEGAIKELQQMAGAITSAKKGRVNDV